MRVRPGEKVPVDGAVIGWRERGRRVDADRGAHAGRQTRWRQAHRRDAQHERGLRCAPSAIGARTVLAQIVQMVSQAQRSKAPMQRLADRVAGHFVVGVAVAALLTFLGWGLSGRSRAGRTA
jgi:Cu+-exporting ATPase